MRCVRFQASVSPTTLLIAGAICVVALPAAAACTIDASNNYTCTGANTTPLTLYDQAAAFQPIAGSNGYTPANPAFPAASNPANPGYNPNPANEVLTIGTGATFTTTVTTANRTTVLSDSGQVAANYSNSEDPAVNNVVVRNSGAFTLINTQSASRASSIVADSQVNNFTVNNRAGATIAVSQTAPTFAAFNAGLLTAPLTGTPPAASARYAGATFAITSAFYSDDNTNEFTVNNAAGASVTAAGHYTAAYYGRADTTITNGGTIANTDWVASDTISAGHWAIAAYAGTDYNVAPNTNPDSNIVIPNADGSVTVNDTSALTLTNKASGKIKGDILALDITPLVYAAAVGASTNPFPDPTQTTLLQLPVSSSNGGPRDSNIQNLGTIAGNFYLGSGTHVIDNAAGATMQGSVDVDQRPVQVNFSEPNAGTVAGTFASKGGTDFTGSACPMAGANTTDAGCATTSTKTATVVGAQSLTLTNEGTFTGDIRIFDQATSVNSIALTGTGFTGNVVAVNGTGSNTLTLDGVTNLQSVRNFSKLNFMSSNVAVANGVSLVDGATIRTTIFGPGGTTATPSTNLGSMTGTLTLLGDTRIVPVFAATVTNGSVYQLASQVASAGTITVRKTALVTLTPDTSSGALNLRATVKSAANAAPGISRPGAQTIDGLTSYTGSNAQVQALGGIVEGLRSGADVAAAGQALSPTVNGADVQIPINSAMLFHQQIDARLDTFLYSQIPASGRSADLGVARPTPVYGVVPPNGAWAEGIGGGVHQSTVAGVSGYNADLTGVVGGYDRLIAPAFRVGAAFGYIDGSVNNNANMLGTRETIQTYQGLVYAAYEGPRTYLRGSFGYGGVDFQSQRNIAFNGFNDQAYGRHGGNILTARGEGGLPVEFHDNLFVPYAAFTYSRLDQDAYQEQSAAGAGFAYGSASNDSDRSEVGGKAIVPIGALPVFASLFPVGAAAAIEGRAALRARVRQCRPAGLGELYAGGNAFLVTGPTPNRDMLDYSVGLRVGAGPVQIDLSYNALARSSYYQQVGLLRARVLF